MTESQRHRLAISELSTNGFEFFQPYREAVKIRRGSYVRTRIPYFGRYMFVALCESWRQIMDLRGVSGILLDHETLNPLRVREDQIQSVRDKCDRNGIVREEDAPPRTGFKYGDAVYVEKGPLAYVQGTYDGPVGRKREQALFTMFGREQRVVFRVGELKAVEK